MKKDKIKIFVLELMLVVFLFFTLFASNIITRNIFSVCILIYTIIVCKTLKKRDINSIYEKNVIILMLIFSAIYVSIFYLLGFYFGFTKSKVLLSLWSLYKFIIPLSIIIISSEIIRKVFLSQNGLLEIKGKKINISIILTYIAMVLIDLIIYTGIYDFTNLDDFLTALGFVLFASLSCNLLYNYISKRFGYKGIIIYRLITTLFIYIIPITADVYIFLRSFLKMIYPFIIYIILESNYAKNSFVIAYKDKKKNTFLTTITFIILTMLVMLISCRFKYGIIVIGSYSMTGTLNKGDAVIFEQYKNQNIENGQILLFDYNGITTIHRVVKIENIGGNRCYYTKGDANKNIDSGCIKKDKIKGLVKIRIKYIGNPTIWVREMFSN